MTDHSLEQRYGAPSRTRRWIVLAVAVVAAALFLGWLGWAIWGTANPAVSSQELTKEPLGEHQARISFRIKYGDGPVDATCTVRAITNDGQEVGRASVHPDPSEGPDYTVTFRTTRRANAIEWLGCTAPGQTHPR
jgi:hypothetical protein